MKVVVALSRVIAAVLGSIFLLLAAVNTVSLARGSALLVPGSLSDNMAATAALALLALYGFLIAWKGPFWYRGTLDRVLWPRSRPTDSSIKTAPPPSEPGTR